MKVTVPQSLYIITGCSKGIGKAIVDKVLQTDNAAVIGISRTSVKENHRLTHIRVDLSDWQELIKKLNSIFPEAGHYNKVILINNAAWVGELKYIGNLDNASIAIAYAINSIAPAILMNAFVQKYKQLAAEKIIINVSSGAGKNPRDGMSNYCSTKAALDMLTKVANQEAELRKSGIKYRCVSIGATDTPMQDNIREASEENFSTIQRFVDLKKNNTLLAPDIVAEKILALIEGPSASEEVFVYIR
jgi:benzil reductase ((S)-benzoin forming)